MKTIIATAMIVAVGSRASPSGTRRTTSASTFLQPDLHPRHTVCVLQHAGKILASVGICGTPGRIAGRRLRKRGRLPREEAFSHRAASRTPPGHPPIDSTPALEERRRILI